MASVTLCATPKGNGFQATVAFTTGAAISSAETYPTIAAAITAGALKPLEMPGRFEEMDRIAHDPTASRSSSP